MLGEYAAAAFVVAACGFLATRESNVIVLIGIGFMVLGTLYIVYHLHRFGSVRSMPSDLGLTDCLDFHRTERTIATVSHWQVRQPIYSSSVGRWRTYEKHLGALFEALSRRADEPATAAAEAAAALA